MLIKFCLLDLLLFKQIKYVKLKLISKIKRAKQMLNVAKIVTKPNVFHSLTGMSPTKFKLLLQKLEVLWQESEFKRKNYSGRKRKIGGGRKRKLTLEQSLFLLLMYYRTYVNHLFLGMIGNIDDSKICKYFALLEPLLAEEFRVPERKINLSKEEILELIVDATEQPSQKRPGSGYSGKKKRQTVKTQIHVNIKGKIKSVSKSYAGNVHDKKVYDQARTIVTIQDNPSKVNIKADLGYLGTKCEIPIKSSKYHQLSDKEKKHNQKLSKVRIKVEHVFSYIKKFHILSDIYRNNISKYNLIFKNICGLRNFITE